MAGFLHIKLNHGSAVADGQSTITATASYDPDGSGSLQVGVRFGLPSTGSATFINGTKQYDVDTHIDGTVDVDFIDTRAETGTIFVSLVTDPRVNDSAPFEFTPAISVILHKDRESGIPWTQPGIPDSSAIVNLEAVVINGNSLIDYEIHFETSAPKTAWFVDQTSPDSRPATIVAIAHKGEPVSVALADSLIENVKVYAYIAFLDGTNSDVTGIDVPFLNPLPDAVVLQLANDGAIADGQTPITATAKVTRNKQSVSDSLITFEVLPPTSSARFTAVPGTITVSDDGKTASGKSNSDGLVSVSFTDTAAQVGTILAYGEASSGFDRPSDQKPFSFTSLDVKIEIYGVSKTTDGSETLVEWSDNAIALASQEATLQIGARVTAGGKPWSDGKIMFLNMGAASYVPGQGTISGGGTNITVELDGNGMTKLVSLVCPEITSRNMIIASLTEAGSSSADPVTMQYQFTDPWLEVAGVQAAFAKPYDARQYIYANGRHVTNLQVTASPTGPNGAVLPVKLLPKDTFASAKLIAYDDPNFTELGTGNFSNWAYTDIQDKNNPFTTSITADYAERTIKSSSGSVKAANQQNKTYYIQCRQGDGAKDYKFGLAITPTGMQIVSTGIDGRYGYKTGKVTPSLPVYFAQAGQKLPSEQQKIISKIEEVIYNLNDISSKGKLDHAGVQSGKISEISVYPDNFWRQWSYDVSLNSGVYGNYLFQCRIVDDRRSKGDYSFCEVNESLYSYKAYFWPNNVCDANGNSLPSDKNYTMSCGSFPEQDSGPISTTKGKIQLTLFCTFGNFPVGAHNYGSVSVEIYDQYGNLGKFYLDPRNVPRGYDVATMGTWNFLKEGSLSLQETVSSTSTVFYIGTSFFQSVNSLQVGHDDELDELFELKATALNAGDKIGFSQRNDPKKECPAFYLSKESQNYISFKDIHNPNYYDTNVFTWYILPVWSDNNLIITSSISDTGMTWYPSQSSGGQDGFLYAVFSADYQKDDSLFNWFLK